MYGQEEENNFINAINHPVTDLIANATPLSYAANETAKITVSKFGESGLGKFKEAYEPTPLKSFLQFIVLAISLYLAYKCTENIQDSGTKFMHLLGACCCSPCYIIWALFISKCHKF